MQADIEGEKNGKDAKNRDKKYGGEDKQIPRKVLRDAMVPPAAFSRPERNPIPHKGFLLLHDTVTVSWENLYVNKTS